VLFLWLLVLEVVIFGALVLLIRVIFARNLSHATSHLNELNQDYTQKLEDAKKRLQEAERYYDENVLKAKTDAEKLKGQILKEARAEEEGIVNSSRKQSTDIVEQAYKARDVLMKEIEEKVDDRALTKACELVQEILPQEISHELHDKWFAELSKNGFEALKRLNLPDDLSEGQIITPYPLTAEQKSLIEKKVKHELGHAVRLTEKIDPLLIAGVAIHLGSVAIDGSLKFKIGETVRHARSPA